MYQLDKFLGGDTGLKDYNRYLLGMYTNETSIKNTLNKTIKINKRECPTNSLLII